MTTIFHPTQFHGDAAIAIIEHHGINIVHQYDVRGPEHDAFYDMVTMIFDGEECDFNTVDDAINYINRELDIPADEDENEEHRLRSYQLI